MKTKIAILAVFIVIALLGVGAWAFFNATTPKPETSPQQDTVQPTVTLNISNADFELAKTQKALEVSVDADDNKMITEVKYLLDGKVAARSIESPYKASISLAQLSAGEHTLQAAAYDAAGNVGKSKIFKFIIEEEKITPADDDSEEIIENSVSHRSGRSSTVVANHSSGGSSDESNGGDTGDGGGDPDPDPDPGIDPDPARTAGGWWSSLPESMQICSNGMTNNGPATAPEGAITVPAGDNASLGLNQPNKTFWFAPGVHTLGSGIFSSITAGSGSTYIGAPGAIIDGQFVNRYAFQGNATNVRVAYLEIRNFGVNTSAIDPGTGEPFEPVNNNEGVINHDAGDNWTMEYINAHHNDGAAFFLGSANTVRYNCMKDNGQYGFSMFKMPISGDSAIKNIVLDHNEISGNNQDDWEVLELGCGCTGAGKFWDVKGALVTNNYVHDNLSTGLWADTNDIDFLFDSNWIEHNNGEGIWYEISYNATISRNVLKRNAWTTGQKNLGSPGPAIYISESGGDSRLQSSTSGSTDFQIKNNLLEDNFSGVSIFENSNRFCNSNGNTSKGSCTPFVLPTLIPEPHDFEYPNPVSTTHPCYTQVKNAPYTADCRWHSKNVQVFNNEFHFDPAIVPCAGDYCGVQALFATGADNMNGGDYGAWVPTAYNISNVQADVTLHNNNKFYDNAYVGAWRFAKGDGSRVAFANWQSAPYLQDLGSTYDAPPITNYLDNNTATLEGGIGHWQNWFSTTATQSTLEAHTGTHSLQIALDGGNWAVQLDNHPGIDMSPGNKRIGFWAKRGTGSVANMDMRVQWFNENNTQIGVTEILPLTLSSSWQQASADVVAPVGTVKAFVILMSSSGSSGNTVFADDFKIGDAT